MISDLSARFSAFFPIRVLPSMIITFVLHLTCWCLAGPMIFPAPTPCWAAQCSGKPPALGAIMVGSSQILIGRVEVCA